MTRRIPLKLRIAASIFALGALVVAGVLWQTVTTAVRSYETFSEKHLASLLQALEGNATDALRDGHFTDLQNLFGAEIGNMDVVEVVLTGPDGRVVAATVRERIGKPLTSLASAPDEVWLERPVPVLPGAQGRLYLKRSRASLQQLQREVLGMGVAVGLAGTSAMFVVSMILATALTRRLERLRDTALRFAGGDHTARVALPGGDEVAAVGSAFDRMAEVADRALAEQSAVVESLQRSAGPGHPAAANRVVLLSYLDHDLRFRFSSPRHAAWMGLRPEEVVGRTVAEILPAAAHEQLLPRLARALAGETIDFEDRIAYPDGATRDVHVIFVPDFADDGSVRGLSSRTEDVSERKRTEHLLRDTEQRIRLMIDAVPVAISYVDAQMRYVYLNREHASWLNRRREDLIGRSVGEALPPEAYQALEPMLRRVLAGERVEFERPITYPDGRTRDAHLVYVPDIGHDGAVRGCSAIVEDLTERKRAERAQLESEERFRAIAEGVAVPVMVIRGSDPTILYGNRAASELFVGGSQRLQGRRATEFWLDPADRDAMLETLRRKGVLRNYETRVVAHDGSLRWVLATSAPIVFDGEPALLSSLYDITERRDAEQRLREHEMLLQTVFDALPVWVSVKDPDLRYQMINRTALEASGLTAADYLGVRTEDLTLSSREHMQRIADLDRQVMATGARHTAPEQELILPDGTQHFIDRYKVPYRQADGRLAGIVTISVDVTERKRNEDELRSSRALLQAVFDALPVWVSVKGPDLRYQMVNQAALDAAGLTTADYIGVHTRDLPFGSPTDMGRNADFDQRVLSSGTRHVALEQRQLLPDGSLRFMDHYKVPYLHPDGRLAGIVTVSVDVTERKEHEDKLRSSQALLQTVFDVIPMWVFVKDHQGRYLMVNDTYARDIAIPTEQMLGHTHWEMPHGTREQHEQTDARDREAIVNGRVVMAEGTVLLPGGRETIRQVIKAPLRDPSGRIIGLVGISQDITARKRAEEQLRHLNEGLEQRVAERSAALEAAQAELLRKEKMATLGQLTATVSHELRNPLGTIRTSVFTLRQLLGETVNGALRPLERIERNLLRCDNTIRDLLDFSRQRAPVPLPVAIDDWLHALIEEQTVPEGIAVELCSEAGNRTVNMDPEYIRRAVVNLFENAGQALAAAPATAGAAPARITVGTAVQEGQVQITVADNGPGMTPEVLARVFEPLFSTKTYGVGLGLPTVRQIMQQNGGDVALSSVPGQGTTACLRLPLDGAPAQAPT